MLSVIIALVVAGIIVLIAAIAAIFEGQDFGFFSGLGVFAGGTIFAGMIGFCCGMLTVGIGNLALDHNDHYRTVNLIALRDGTGQTGEYFLGTGTTDTTGKYVFYFADSDGARHLVNIDSADVRLYEDSPKPYAIQYMGCDLSAKWVGACITGEPRFVEIHVPTGSIRNQVDLNLNAK
jgi:hypothetical protein